jgi:hypothetical protein
MLLLIVAGLSTIGFSQSYTTHFQGTENPLSEGGRWTNDGLDWTQISKKSGIACGTQTGTNTGKYEYDDSYAHLSGFPSDQEAWGQAYIAKPDSSCNQELEILLRWNSSPHRNTGYECFARCLNSDSSYVQIVRWDGPLEQFTYLADKRGTNFGLKNGDTLKASIVGSVITVYINGVEKARVKDDTFKTGNPGIGEFLACNNGKGISSNSDFGFCSFTARGLGGTVDVSTQAVETIPTPSAAVILERLKKEHPRLLATKDDFPKLRAELVANSTLKQWHDGLRRQADRILSEPPSRYEIPDGLRLLATSRRVLDRVQTLGLLYRLDDSRPYAERAWLELRTAAAFTNWNPRHFLDTAEMTHAFAIGYDWLYDFWNSDQRRVMREAMLEKGIKPANDIQAKDTWWAQAHHNWNQVCNGGISMGALALADEAPEECGRFLEAALKSIQLPMREFAPDGAWSEGPGYWHYATSYNCYFLAALESALGGDFGLSQMVGFSQAGMFPIFASGPTGKSFDFADAHAEVIRAPELFWLAAKFNEPTYAVYQRKVASGQPLDLLWYDPLGEGSMPNSLPLDKYFRHAEVAMLRSAWDDPNALWVAFKAGDNKANHSHLDLGSFVFEAVGDRWAVDLGSDDYNMPDYFGKQRWTYYRLRAEGHNTLVFNPGKEADQDPAAASRIVRFESGPNPFAIADLTAAYKQHATKVERGIVMPGKGCVLVQDEFETVSTAEVWWFLHTPADLKADGREAILSLHGKRLTARILAPAGAQFTVMDAKPLPTCPAPTMQDANRGVRKLAIRLNGVTRERIAVLLDTETDQGRGIELKPLAEW